MLKGKIALITGAGSGVGLEICKEFAKEGATLILVDIQDTVKDVLKEVSKEHKQEMEHMAHKCDITKRDEVKRIFKEIKDKYKRPANVIVNCAGIYLPNLFHETPETDYDTYDECQFKRYIFNFTRSGQRVDEHI